MRYRIISNDERFVTQNGTQPSLTKSPALAYVWDTAEEAKAMLPRYWEALKHTGILALAVFPVQEAPKRI